jgi:hypothetical protein
MSVLVVITVFALSVTLFDQQRGAQLRDAVSQTQGPVLGCPELPSCPRPQDDFSATPQVPQEDGKKAFSVMVPPFKPTANPMTAPRRRIAVISA